MGRPAENRDMNWWMLLSIAVVILGGQYLVSYGVIYTEGEVLQGAYQILMGATAGTVSIGFYRRQVAAWCLIGFGGLVLLWQIHATRKLIMLHEEVVGIIRFVEDTKKGTGVYPVDLGAYPFKRPWMPSHVMWVRKRPDDYRLNYFMYSLGTAFWYTPGGGFEYYPD
jgi:hypothetical protein